MYQVLLNSDLILKSLSGQNEKFSKEFDKLWEILKSSEEEKYSGYITKAQWLKLSFCLKERCIPNTANDLLSHFSKVLNIGQIYESTGFTYIVNEEMTSLDSNSKYVSVEQFLMRYEADKMHNLPCEEGAGELIFNLEPDSPTGFDQDNVVYGEDNDLLESHSGDDSLFGSWESDSLTGIANNGIITGEDNDLLESHSGDDSLFGSD